MNHVNGLAQQEYLIAQWFECSIDIIIIIIIIY